MDTVLLGVPRVTCYIDDILVSSVDEDSHLQSLEEVFNHSEKHGFKLKPEKCEFVLKSIEYCKYRIAQNFDS